MGIIYHDDWDLSEKGVKDAERHREKIDDAIRKSVRDVIGEESIITRKGKKKIKITVKGMKDYRFIYGNEKGAGAGVGQGPGKPGDVIGRKPKKGQGQGKSGQAGKDDPGDDVMETEVDIDYLLDIMFEDLGLPWIEEKTKSTEIVPKGWKFETISKKGIFPQIHKKRTMIEAIKRSILFVAEIQKITGCSEKDAKKSLTQAMGNLNEAVKIIKEGKLNGNEPTIFIDTDDLRYKQMEQDVEHHSKAVVICMMDVSGSMGREKKYLCRSLLFWMTEFLKKKYEHVENKFIQHTTVAKVVDEDTFFHKDNSGGTQCYTAFEKANYMIDTEYPINEWNVYCIYVGDGEDWDVKRTLIEMNRTVEKNVNMLGYIEVKPVDEWSGMIGDNTLIVRILRQWNFNKTVSGKTVLFKNMDKRILLSTIKDKTDVWPTLKHLLFKKD